MIVGGIISEIKFKFFLLRKSYPLYNERFHDSRPSLTIPLKFVTAYFDAVYQAWFSQYGPYTDHCFGRFMLHAIPRIVLRDRNLIV